MNKIAGIKQIQYYIEKLVESKDNYFQDVRHDRFGRQHDRAQKTNKIYTSCMEFWHDRVRKTHDRARLQFKIYLKKSSLNHPHSLPLGQARPCQY